MALQRLQRIITLSSLMLVTATAFSAQKASQLVRTSSCPSALDAAVAVPMDDETEDPFLMSRATACASSETCGLDEAESYLNDVLTAQRDCLDVTIANANSALCDDVADVAEVVSSLRLKIEAERKRLAPIKAVTNFANVVVGIYVVSAIVHGFAAVPNVPIDVPLYTPFEPLAESTRGVTSILPQEWYWAVRDGYFPSLFSEWVQHGGLVVDASAFDSKAVAFTPQEWVWSIQNGSFGNLMEENMRYGGYHVDSTFDTEGMSPMNGQDVLYSIKGGYVGDAVKHFFRNGGL